MKVLKVEECFVYFPLLELHNWGKDSLLSEDDLSRGLVSGKEKPETGISPFQASVFTLYSTCTPSGSKVRAQVSPT